MKEQKDIFNYLNKKDSSTPDASYFENMADNIIAKETKKSKVIPLFKKPSFWMIAAAASIAFFVFLNLPASNNNSVLLSFNDISTSEIESYIDHNFADFDSDLISEFISEINIEETALEKLKEVEIFEAVESTIELDNINSDEILDYFNTEEIDIYEEDLELDYNELYI